MSTLRDNFTMMLHDTEGPSEVLGALALVAFVDGEEPWASTVRLQRLRPEATLLPAGCEPERTVRDEMGVVHLVRGDGWTLVVRRWGDVAMLVVTGRDEACGQAVLDEVTADACEPPPPEDEAVLVGFWYFGGVGPVRNVRPVTVERWSAIRRNYSSGVARALDSIVAITPDRVPGKLLLLHGPTGTGKTTALRCIAGAWQEWCTLELVLDPERLFGDSAYLMSLVLGEGDSYGGDPPRWRLLALEDCDELIGANAKAGSGQALSRLLNLTDGIVGQGLRILVAITSNEPLSALHPAVTRPGRCLAEVEVGRLDADECRRWFDRPFAVPPEGMTIAELWARRSELEVVRNERSDDVAVGHYL